MTLSACGGPLAADDGLDDGSNNDQALKSGIALNPGEVRLTAGQSVEASVTTQDTASWSLKLSALPSGVTATFSSTTVTKAKPVVVTFRATSSATLGQAAFTVTARASTKTSTAKGTLRVIAPGSAERLRNVDVSVVYPLPAVKDLDALMKAADPGVGGTLLGESVFAGNLVPVIDDGATLPPGERLRALRVVAARFDPCPGTLLPPTAPANCRPDVRLVFQQLQVDGGLVRATDGAIHAFYEMPTAAFERVLADLRATRAANAAAPEVPLGVHPTLAREGVSGAFANHLKALISSVAGMGTLVRVTHFDRVITGAGQRWLFAMREKKAGAWSDSTIATTTVKSQGLLAIVGGRWDADITPPLTHGDDVTRVFKVTQKEEAEAFRATARVLNPRIHSSESVDCSSCHIAPDVAGFGETVRSLSLDAYPERFRSAYPLTSVTKSNEEAIAFENIHLFSYLGRGLNVSARAANETAAILEMLNQ